MSMAPDASLREVIRREQFDLAKLNACMEKLHYYNCREYNQPHPSIIKKYRSTGILRFPVSWPFNERQDNRSQRSAYFFTQWKPLARIRDLTLSGAVQTISLSPSLCMIKSKASDCVWTIVQDKTDYNCYICPLFKYK